MKRRCFFVYEHWRPDKDICFYVGKGRESRAYSIRRKENAHYGRVTKKLARLGLCVEVRLVKGNLFEDEAFSLEVERIAFWRSVGITLVNQTDGGEGSSGFKMPSKACAKIAAFQKGRPKPHFLGRKLTAEHKAKISPLGRHCSEETRAKISAAQKGKLRPELIGRKLSPEGVERLHNRIFTEEHRRKISDAKKGKPKSQEHRKKLSQALLGRNLSKAQREAIGRGNREAWKRRRLAEVADD